MCGRYGRTATHADLIERLGFDPAAAGSAADTPRYNQPPGEFTPVCLPRLDDREAYEVADLFWGFVPSWADDPGRAQINARSETADRKPYWRKAFHRRHCVIAADWWYEWQRDGERRQPYAMRPAGGAPFFFAGLWSLARNLPANHKAAGQRTFAILTTPAADELAAVHPRMPIALTPEGARQWLALRDDTQALHRCLAEQRHARYEHWPITARVNSPKHDDAELLEIVDV